VSIDTWAVVLVVGMAFPATAFPILYATRPWYRSLLGRALMTKAIGLALLIDLAVAHHFGLLGDSGITRLVVYSLVFLGLWQQLIALCLIIWRAWRDRRTSTALGRRRDAGGAFADDDRPSRA
jgi:hypothetical protein